MHQNFTDICIKDFLCLTLNSFNLSVIQNKIIGSLVGAGGAACIFGMLGCNYVDIVFEINFSMPFWSCSKVTVLHVRMNVLSL
jgi:hypothetical protein